MTSLLEALSAGFDTVGSKANVSNFAKKLDSYKNMIVNEFLKYNISLNKLIAKVAKQENLNDDQIQRIVEEVNNQVYLIKYTQMKNSPEREVVFDLASLKGVKEEIDGVSTTVKPENGNDKTAHDNTGYIEKKASWDNNVGDKLNFLNYSAGYDCNSLSPDAMRSKKSIDIEKIALDIKTTNDQIKYSIDKVAQYSNVIADTLIQYKKHGLNEQDIFDTICKEANCNSRDQLLIKKTADNRINVMKNNKELPSNFEFNIELTNTAKEAEDFSLKQYSFAKEAGFQTASNQPVPIVITDEAVVKNINDLIKTVEGLSQNSELAKQNMKAKDDMIKENNLTIDQAEKLAKAGKGFNAFVKSLTGATARSAKKEVAETGEELIKKMNNDKLKSAQKTVEELVKSTKNIDVHPRMKDVNEKLQDAYSKYNKTVSETDKVLNESALKNPFTRTFGPKTNKARIDNMIEKSRLNRTKNMANNQEKRIVNDLNDQIFNAKKNVSNITKELNIPETQEAFDKAQKAYEKAVRSRNRARAVTAAGAGTAVAASKAVKNKKEQNNGVYYY